MTNPTNTSYVKGCLFIFISIVILSSCSTPKYTYYFDHYDYNSGKKENSSQQVATSSPEVISHSAIDEKTLVASANEYEMYVAKPTATISENEVLVKINSMSKEEKRELKREVRKFVKENKREIKSGKATHQLENDVKLAAIFGAVGLVLLIIGGEVIYVLGAVALLIGLYFFIRWLVRQ